MINNAMRDEDKSKEELIIEIESLRKQVAQLREMDSFNDLARKALSRSVETFRGLFEQATDSIFLLEPGETKGPIIADANIAACKTHGYTKEELIGQPIALLDAPETARHVEERAERLARGEKLTFEGEHIRKDGSVFPVEVSAQLVKIAGKPYVLAIDRDITEHRNSLEKIRKERDRAQLFFDFAGVMLLVINADETVGMINKKGCEMLGYEREEIIGKNWFDLCIPGHAREEVRRTFRRIINGEIESLEYYRNPVINKEGEEVLIAWHNTILHDEKGDIMATLSSGEDMSRRN